MLLTPFLLLSQVLEESSCIFFAGRRIGILSARYHIQRGRPPLDSQPTASLRLAGSLISCSEGQRTLCWPSGLIEAMPRLEDHCHCGRALCSRVIGVLCTPLVRKARYQHLVHTDVFMMLFSDRVDATRDQLRREECCVTFDVLVNQGSERPCTAATLNVRLVYM